MQCKHTSIHHNILAWMQDVVFIVDTLYTKYITDTDMGTDTSTRTEREPINSFIISHFTQKLQSFNDSQSLRSLYVIGSVVVIFLMEFWFYDHFFSWYFSIDFYCILSFAQPY